MRCMSTTNILQRVVDELKNREGQMVRISRETQLAYDTVLRIKNGEGDPSYGKVQALHDYLFPAQREAA